MSRDNQKRSEMTDKLRAIKIAVPPRLRAEIATAETIEVAL